MVTEKWKKENKTENVKGILDHDDDVKSVNQFDVNAGASEYCTFFILFRRTIWCLYATLHASHRFHLKLLCYARDGCFWFGVVYDA